MKTLSFDGSRVRVEMMSSRTDRVAVAVRQIIGTVGKVERK